MTLFAFRSDPCRRLADELGTPSFLYRASRFRDRVQLLRAALPDRVQVAYAVKANPGAGFLAAAHELGLSLDCASQGELDRALAAGFSGSRLFFAGPGKRGEEIRSALELGARLQAEGIEDLRRAEALAAGLGLEEVVVNLRVQPAEVAGEGGFLGGSGPTAFGVDEEDLDGVLTAASGLRRVRICGLHGFAASNERDADRLLAIHRRMFAIAERLQRALGCPLEQIDLGGGLGVPYAAAESPIDLTRLGRGLERILAENPWFVGDVILEPGRFLAAACGVYLSRVLRVKHSRGERFLILEGGINHLLRPLLTGQPFPVRAIGASGEPSPAVLAGPLCTALDRLGRVELPPLEPGALLAFGMTGAYASTEAMGRFLDHPPPTEHWLEELALEERAFVPLGPAETLLAQPAAG